MQDNGLTKSIPGVPSSETIRKKLKDEGGTVAVAFSGGKDAIATALALKDEGIPIELCYLYGVPGKKPGEALDFVEDGLKRLEDQWQLRIHRYPHPSFYRKLNNLVFQAPENCLTIERADLPSVSYEEIWRLIREDLGLPLTAWVADGVRAADSLVRRASIKKHGAMKFESRKVSPIWDWKQGKTFDYIKSHGVELPVDYELFGRSFDGIDYRFLKPIHDRFPEDYEQILKWFPLAELELIRHEL